MTAKHQSKRPKSKRFKRVRRIRRREFEYAAAAVCAVICLLAALSLSGCASGRKVELAKVAPGVVRSVQANGDAVEAKLSSEKVINGGVLSVTITAPSSRPVHSVTVHYNDLEIPAYEFGTHRFQAILGIPYTASPSSQKVEVRLNRNGSETEILELPFEIVDGGYPSETLTVSPRHVNPPPKDLERIKVEREELKVIYETITPVRYWVDGFSQPIKSRVTSVFGSKRVFNGQLKSFHSGLDLAARVGTRIYSSAAGKVVLAKNLFFSGNTVLVDHGYGVMTLYAHLSRIRVKPGQLIKRGQLVGLAGATGRVSGPHLHWGAVIHGEKVSPRALLQILDRS